MKFTSKEEDVIKIPILACYTCKQPQHRQLKCSTPTPKPKSVTVCNTTCAAGGAAQVLRAVTYMARHRHTCPCVLKALPQSQNLPPLIPAPDEHLRLLLHLQLITQGVIVCAFKARFVVTPLPRAAANEAPGGPAAVDCCVRRGD